MQKELVESFLMVAQYKNITFVAEKLFVSQSTLSHRLQILERDLGVTLFNRKQGVKKITLTQEGEYFRTLAVQWLNIDDSMHRLSFGPTSNNVRIAGLDSVNEYLLFNILFQIREAEPNLQLEFFSFHSWEIYRKLSVNSIDIGFAFYPVHYNNIIATPVFQEPVVMISPPGSIYDSGPIDPASLQKQDEIYYAWDSNLARWHSEWWDSNVLPYVSVDSSALLLTFLVHPASWAMCPASVATSLRAQSLVEIHPFTVSPPDRICYMLRQKASKNSANQGIDIFINRFNSFLTRHPWRWIDKQNDM